MPGKLDLEAALVQKVLAPIVLTNGDKAGVLVGNGGDALSNFLVDVGAGGGSATIGIEESDDDVTYTTVKDYTGSAVTFALTSANAGQAQAKNGNRTKTYLRAAVTGTSGTIIAGVTLVEGKVYAAPAGQASGSQTDYSDS